MNCSGEDFWKITDFARKLDSVMDEGEIEEKGMLKCKICGKDCVSSRGLKRHQGMKHKNDRALPEKVSKLTASEFYSLLKRCSSIYQQDLRLPKDIRSKFGSFDFTDDDALKLWKYYMKFYGLRHKNLLWQKFEGDIIFNNILLPEITKHLDTLCNVKRWHR